MSKAFSLLRFLLRFLVRAAVGVVLLALLALAYLATFGVPEDVVRRAVAAASAGPFSVDAVSARFDPWRGVVLRDVRIHRKRQLGPAMVEARRVFLTVDPLALWNGGQLVQSISIKDAELRPEMVAAPAGSAAPEPFPEKGIAFGVELENCRVQGVDFPRVEGDVTLRGYEVRVTDVRGSVARDEQQGTFRGEFTVNQRARVIAVHLETEADPRILDPLFRRNNMAFAADLFRQFDFDAAPPRVEADFERQLASGGWLTLDGHFWMRDCSFRGTDIVRGDGGLQLRFSSTNSTVRVDPLILVRDEGMVKGGFTVHPSQGMVDFTGASTIHPPALFRMLNILTNEMSRTFTFGGPVSVSGQGKVDFVRMAGTDFRLDVSGRKIGLATLDADECSFRMHMTGRTNHFEELLGSMYGGRIEGDLVLVMPFDEDRGVRYAAEGRVVDADFQRLVAGRIRAPKEQYTGQFSAQAKVEGLVGEGCGKTAAGQGSVQIKGGRLFLMPVFGGLSQQLAGVIPGVEFVLRQTDGSADFVVRDGKISSQRILIEGGVLSLEGRGVYGLDESLDFDVQIRLLKQRTLVGKILRIPTYVLSKLFEFRLQGMIADPEWKPVNFSWGLRERLGFGRKRGESAIRELQEMDLETNAAPAEVAGPAVAPPEPGRQ